MQKLRVGIISANWGLHGHFPAWKALPGVEVLGICTAHRETAEAAAQAHGIPRAYWDYREMVADQDLDIIDVGTRPSLRFDMVIAALEAGKHVFDGIPFALDMVQADAMLALSRRKRAVAVVDGYFQWVPAIARAKEMIEEGFLGDLYGVTCNLHVQMTNAMTPQFNYKWLAQQANGASALRNFGSHCLHALVYLFGDVSEVVGQYGLNQREWRLSPDEVIRPQVPDIASFLVKFARGGMGTVNPCWSVADGRGFFLEAYGSKGRLVIRADPPFPDAPTTRLFAGTPGPMRGTGPSEAAIEIPERLLTVSGTTYSLSDERHLLIPMARCFDDFARSVRSGGDGAPSFSQAWHVQSIVEAVHQSIERKAWVDVPRRRP